MTTVLHQPNRVTFGVNYWGHSIFSTQMPGFNGATGNGSEGVAFPTGRERFLNVLDASTSSDMAYHDISWHFSMHFLHFKWMIQENRRFQLSGGQLGQGQGVARQSVDLRLGHIRFSSSAMPFTPSAVLSYQLGTWPAKNKKAQRSTK